MSIKQTQDKICQLIFRAETFLKWSTKLLDIYENRRDKSKSFTDKEYKFYNYPETKCIILHQVLYFQEVVIILHTLLENKKHPTEMSFAYYFTKSKNKDLEKEINDIRDEYRTSYLDKFRNKLIAHKQAESAGDPLAGFLNPVKRVYIEKACSIIERLRILVIDNFDCAVNNYFGDYYNSGFEVLYKICNFTKSKN
jgi:hypothetical protein